MFEALPMGNSWHDAQVLDAWDYMWKHLMAKVAGLWHGCA
jgi:mannose/cellobiose epimerase-like protein (N-acyl-D-glucosamine 2-epimerase family)